MKRAKKPHDIFRCLCLTHLLRPPQKVSGISNSRNQLQSQASHQYHAYSWCFTGAMFWLGMLWDGHCLAPIRQSTFVHHRGCAPVLGLFSSKTMLHLIPGIPAWPSLFVFRQSCGQRRKKRRKRKKCGPVWRWDVVRVGTFGNWNLGSPSSGAWGRFGDYLAFMYTGPYSLCESYGFSKVTLPWLAAILWPSGCFLFMLSICSFRKASCLSV